MKIILKDGRVNYVFHSAKLGKFVFWDGETLPDLPHLVNPIGSHARVRDGDISVIRPDGEIHNIGPPTYHKEAR